VLLLALLTLSVGTLPLPAPTRAAEPSPITLVLKLPDNNEYPERERMPSLTVDGKKFRGPYKAEHTIKVSPAKEGDALKVVFSYWPVSYTNIIRTKVVKPGAKKTVEVDLTKEDLATPDLIKPIYYPTPKAVVEEMLKLAKVGSSDVVYDIGCGDGRMVIMGVQKGAKRGVGIDIDPDLVKLCKENAKKAGVSDKVEFRNEDALKIKDLSDATVVLLYVGEDFGAKLGPVLKKTLKPGSRIISHRFPLGDWKPDSVKKINTKNNYDEDEDYELLVWTIK
jgi:tRNA G37 N-methylase Trm5